MPFGERAAPNDAGEFKEWTPWRLPVPGRANSLELRDSVDSRDHPARTRKCRYSVRAVSGSNHTHRGSGSTGIQNPGGSKYQYTGTPYGSP